MPTCSASARETERLLDLLHAYDRDELWLRTQWYYRLTGQPNQVWFDVVDADGIALADRWGRLRSDRLQVHAPWVPVVPGQIVHLSRAGDGVWVQLLPLAGDALRIIDVGEVQGRVGA
jgi:hypothetical protein